MFRRGFKAWAEEISANVRKSVGVANDAPVDPASVAESLNVPVVLPSELADLSRECAGRLTTDHRGEWSAITVSDGRKSLIVVNSAHAVTRRNSSLAHELAHIILGHQPSIMFIAPGTGTALRTHNKDQEDEAAWLSGAVLLPRAALLRIRRQRLTSEQACDLYQVSPAMLQYRFQATGVNLQIGRARRRSSRSGR